MSTANISAGGFCKPTAAYQASELGIEEDLLAPIESWATGKVVAYALGATESEAIARAQYFALMDDLTEACSTFLKHYDENIRRMDLGDEDGIADMRRVLAKAIGDS